MKRTMKTVLVPLILPGLLVLGLLILSLPFLLSFIAHSIGNLTGSIESSQKQPWDRDWVVNGKYKGFKNDTWVMEKLMALAAEGDADTIYAAFSRNAKQNVDHSLKARTEELVHFLGEDVTSWEYKGGGESEHWEYGMGKTDRLVHSELYVGERMYVCLICDIRVDSWNENNVGIYSIEIYPMEMDENYSEIKFDGPGISILYEVPEGFELNPQE